MGLRLRCFPLALDPGSRNDRMIGIVVDLVPYSFSSIIVAPIRSPTVLSVLIYQDLYDADSLNTKFIPVLFDSTDEQHIPRPLRGATHYRVDIDEGYERLYRRLTKQPARVKPPPGQVVHLPPETLKRPVATVWNVPFERNVFFTGREKELEKLRQALAENSAAALSQTQAISGLGDIGKTQMAIEYTYQHREEYKAVLWVRADSEQSIITGYAEAAKLTTAMSLMKNGPL